jgi:TetR/AcrR family transcriptional regulator, lmrAB and yxaGH operons repressor
MKPEDADLVSTAVLSQFEGALLLARTYRSLEPLHCAEEAVKLLANLQRTKGPDAVIGDA